MGSWGVGSFEDDAALDWVGDVLEGGQPQAVIQALNAVLDVPGGEYLDLDVGSEGRAAAEVVAIVFGHPPEGLSQIWRRRILTFCGDLRRDPDLPAKAMAALGRIWSDHSELYHAWTENEDEAGAEWTAALTDLTTRLTRAKEA